ncbi:MAG: VCBS repeat-containing protein, partial [Phycisphaerales bacterium]|nr:VCBS repeat-containing protein [Phycisphaerales bacterium]
RIDSLNTAAPIVAMTANAFDGDKRACFEVGMSDFVSKPDAERIAVFESWGWTVTAISGSESSVTLDAALVGMDVVYISEVLFSGDLNTKILDTTVGVLIEEGALFDDFKIASNPSGTFVDTEMTVVTNAHDITTGFSTGLVTINDVDISMRTISGSLASGLTILGRDPATSVPVFGVIDTGGALYGSGTAAGRRVALPWANSGHDIDNIGSNGLTMLRRAIIWAAELDPASEVSTMLARWKLDESTGTLAEDATGNGYDGTLTNGPVWSPNGGLLLGALDFDGTDDDVIVTGLITEPESYTLTGWVRTSSGTDDEILSLGDYTGLRVNGSGAVHAFFWNGTDWKDTTGGSGAQDGAWHHVAYTRDDSADEQKLYLDGTLVQTTTHTDDIEYTTLGSNTHIGMHGDGDTDFAMDGLVDDVRIYAGVLSAAAIAELAAPPIRYVRQSGSNGSNGETPATAWRTVDYAADNAEPGMIVYIGAGTYSESVTPSDDGTEDEWITFVGDVDGLRTGDAGTITVKSSSDPLEVSYDDYLEFRNITFDADGDRPVDLDDSDGLMFVDCIFKDGNLSGVSIDDTVVTFIDCEFTDSSDDGVAITSDSTVVLTRCTITGSGDDCIDIANNSGISVTASECTFSDIVDDCFDTENGTVVVVNSLITNIGDDAVAMNSTGSVTVVHCTLFDIGDDAFMRLGGTLTVTNCVISGVGDDAFNGAATHSYNLLHDVTGSLYSGTSAGTGEITGDPLFYSAGDYHLTTLSPAIDAGTVASAYTTIDRDGESRPQDSGWDMGCYEGSETGAPAYTDVSAAMGFDVQTVSSDYSGFHWIDLDNDGDLDCLAMGDGSSRYLANNGSAFFSSTFSTGGRDRHGAWFDVDNDGDIDFFHAAYGSTAGLFVNDGSGGLVDNGASGVTLPSGEEGMVADDINNDGRIDFVLFGSSSSWLCLHDGTTPGEFTLSSAAGVGLNDTGDHGNGDFASAADVNDDGYLDILYNYNSGKLFLSDGDGTFTQNNLGISYVTGNSAKIGTAWADYDNDGDMDVFVPSTSASHPGYLFNYNGSTFTNVASSAGITTDAAQSSCAWGDYDNDGDLDLYVSTIGASAANQFYVNDGDGTFTLADVGAEAAGDGHDVAFMDYNMDGNLDLAVMREDTTNILLKNTRTSTSFLYVRPIGIGASGTNAACIGTRIELYDAAGTTLLARRHHGTARGFGTESQWVHFGGVDPTETYTVRVYFRTGTVDVSVVPGSVSTTIGSTTINQMLTVEEDALRTLQVFQWSESDPRD